MTASLSSRGSRNHYSRTKTVLALITCTAISQSALAAAPAIDFNLLRNTLDGFQKLNMAQRNVQLDQSVRTLLEGNQLNSLSLVQKVDGQGVETVKFQHYIKGIEVVGSRVMHHWGKNGPQVRDMLSRFDLNLEPTVTAEAAAAIAKGNVGDRELVAAPELKVLPSQDDNTARLVHWIRVKSKGFEPSRQIVIDAHTGEVIANVSDMLTIAPIQVYSAKDHGTSYDSETGETRTSPSFDQCQMIDAKSGYPERVDATNCEQVVRNSQVGSNADASAKRAADNSTQVLTYYKTKHGRNSFDNRGADTVSVVHVGLMFQNAAWMGDQKIMIYGDGDGKTDADFTSALDVAGHEMTHGVVGETAQFNYFGESGALNEAFADFFGKMIENEGDWVIGRKLFPNGGGRKGFRDLENPANFTYQYREGGKTKTKPYPAQFKDIAVAKGECGDTNDYCYVHINSTVPSHAAYLVLKAIGQDNAEKLYYLAMTQYLGANDTFKTYASTVLNACGDIKDFDQSTCDKVRQAFVQVGLM